MNKPRRSAFSLPFSPACAGVGVLVLLCAALATARPAGVLSGNKSPDDAGFAIDLTASEADVLKAVQNVVQDEVIRGTYVYENEQTLIGAAAETSSSYYGEWKGEGHVFYKVFQGAVAPRHFKNSNDIGAITVRYVVQGVSPIRTHLEIDAIFVENGTHRAHASDSTVETSEFADIQARLVQIQRAEQQNAARERLRERAQEASKEREQEIARLNEAESSVQGLQKRANELQRQVEVRVIDADTELKSAPFHSSGVLASLPANSDLLVEIITPYWYGVETTDGHRGWVRREQVKQLP